MNMGASGSQKKDEAKELAVPFFAQKSEADCGLAVLRMMYGYCGKTNRPDGALLGVAKAISSAGVKTNFEEGISPADLGKICEKVVPLMGLDYQHGWKLDFDTVKLIIDAGSPIIVYAQPGPQAPVGHFFILVGYGEASNKPYFILHDPQGAQSKAVYVASFPSQYYNEGEWEWYESFFGWKN